MNKTNQKTNDLDDILQILIKSANGISIVDIETRLNRHNQRRTLQRQLRELISKNKIITTGKGRVTKYQLDTSIEMVQESSQPELIPLSKQGRELQHLISLPIQKRDPVGYNRCFLDEYEPNITSYLTREEKEKLAILGATSQMNATGGTYAKQILQRLLIDFAWNSSRLEGNTYSLLDTQRLLDQGLSADDKSAAETQMILNHKDAIEFIVNNTEDIGFNRYTILNTHALLSNNLLPNPAASGSLRINGVGIAGSVYTPPSIPQLIEEMFALMLKKAEAIQDPFENAFFIMVHLPYLQPFDDVNKRVSRLAANIPLNKKNLSPLSFIEVPEKIYINSLLSVYELNRIELLKDVFLWAYDRSAKQYTAQRQSLGEPDPFRLRYRDTIRSLIAGIITGTRNKNEASKIIKDFASTLSSLEEDKFIQTVENELISLHEGNFARYFVTPSQFKTWQQVWNTK